MAASASQRAFAEPSHFCPLLSWARHGTGIQITPKRERSEGINTIGAQEWVGGYLGERLEYSLSTLTVLHVLSFFPLSDARVFLAGGRFCCGLE